MAISLDVHLAGQERGGVRMEEIMYVPFEMCKQKSGEPVVLCYREKKELIKRLPFSRQGEGGRGRRGWLGLIILRSFHLSKLSLYWCPWCPGITSRFVLNSVSVPA